MATTRQLVLHENLLGGVETALPAHLLKPDQWRTQHNMRLTPTLTQIPKKVLFDTNGSDDILWIGHIPGSVAGYGKTVFLTKQALIDIENTTLKSGLAYDSIYRRWSAFMYAGTLYYANELNAIRSWNGTADALLTEAPKARYILPWYDHIVAAYVTASGTTWPSRLMISDLYNFNTWTPTNANEADYYDFVEWQQTDFPYIGCTGLAKIGGTLWVFTPTAIIPLRYVGKPKVFQVVEDSIVTRIGNTYPYTLVALDKVAFFYDGLEKMFFAFDGQQPIPIGEPIRKYVMDNLSTDVALASKMFGYVDVDNREIWWNFVSTSSAGTFDKAVVFNYRLRRWFTASVENVHAFCSGIFQKGTIAQLVGEVHEQTGLIQDLGSAAAANPRLFGAETGKFLREELTTDDDSVLLTADDPVLETGDFHYGDIRTKKENDGMVLNASWSDTQTSALVEVKAKGRDYLGTAVDWTSEVPKGNWTPLMEDGLLTYPAINGRVLRYQFTLKNTRMATVDAFSDAILVAKAEK